MAGEHRKPSPAPCQVELEIFHSPPGEYSACTNAVLFAQNDFSDFTLESEHQTLGAVFFRVLGHWAPLKDSVVPSLQDDWLSSAPTFRWG